MKIIISILVGIILSSCTVYKIYQLDEMHKTMAQYFEKINTSQKQLEIHQSYLLKLSNLPKGQLSSKIIGQINNLDKEATNLKVEIANLEKAYTDSSFSKIKEIKSNNPEFEKVEPFQKDLKKRGDAVNQMFKKYSENWNLLSIQLEENKIFVVNTEEISNNLNDSLNSFNQTVTTVKGSVTMFESKLNSNNLSNAKKEMYKSKLIYMKKDLESIETVSGQFKDYYSSVRKELENQKEVIVLPGMKSFGYIEKIKNYIDMLNILVSEYNRRSDELRKIK